MSQEKHHHHHLFHHKKNEEEAVKPMVYSDTTYADDGYGGSYPENTAAMVTSEEPSVDYEKEVKDDKRKERLGELGATAAGGFALYEKHEEEKDPEHAHRHKLEEEMAGAAAVGAGGYSIHEHHEKKEAKEEENELHGKKHHHHLF